MRLSFHFFIEDFELEICLCELCPTSFTNRSLLHLSLLLAREQPKHRIASESRPAPTHVYDLPGPSPEQA